MSKAYLVTLVISVIIALFTGFLFIGFGEIIVGYAIWICFFFTYKLASALIDKVKANSKFNNSQHHDVNEISSGQDEIRTKFYKLLEREDKIDKSTKEGQIEYFELLSEIDRIVYPGGINRPLSNYPDTYSVPDFENQLRESIMHRKLQLIEDFEKRYPLLPTLVSSPFYEKDSPPD